MVNDVKFLLRRIHWEHCYSGLWVYIIHNDSGKAIEFSWGFSQLYKAGTMDKNLQEHLPKIGDPSVIA